MDKHTIPNFYGGPFPKACTSNLTHMVEKACGAHFFQSYLEVNATKDDRYNFDTMSSKLKGEARKRFLITFSGYDRNKLKSFEALSAMFQAEYTEIVDADILLALRDIDSILATQKQSIENLESQVKTIDILVERLSQLEPLAFVVQEQKSIIQKLQLDKNQLQNKISVLEDTLAKTTMSKCDTMKSLQDKQEHLQKEISALKPAVSVVDTSALECTVDIIQQDFTAQRHLLEALQKQVSALTSSFREPPCVNSVSARSVKLTQMPNESTRLSCELCGANTHSSSTCGAKQLKCRRCHKVGHLARCCQNQFSSVQCQRCGLYSHTSDQCGALVTGLQCWNCCEQGHLHRMCPHLTDRFRGWPPYRNPFS